MSKKNEKNRKKHERRRIEHNSHLKELEALKNFRISTLRILVAMGIPGLMETAHKEDVENYYRKRVGGAWLAPEKGSRVSKRILEGMRQLMAYYLKIEIFEEPDGFYTLEDFLTAGVSLAGFKTHLEKSKHESSRKAAKWLFYLNDLVDNHKEEPVYKLLTIGKMVQSVYSRVNGSMYCLMRRQSPEIKRNGIRIRFSCSYEVRQIKPVCMDVIIDGKSRPVYRIGWPEVNVGMVWKQLCGKDLRIEGEGAEKPMNVYVQSHALIRLKERIDTLDHSSLHLEMVFSLQRKEISFIPNGKILLAYYLCGYKLGYFVMEVIDGMVIIRTFLFITNSGSPEGDRLDSELNIGKFEKQFVGIDKLSAFVHSDLSKNERVRNIFEKVGLGYLNELDKNIFNRENVIKKGYAADFLKVMNVSKY